MPIAYLRLFALRVAYFFAPDFVIGRIRNKKYIIGVEPGGEGEVPLAKLLRREATPPP